MSSSNTFRIDGDIRALTLLNPWAHVITSAGREATQSVWHLHLHVVPRRANDGLALPWYSGRSGKKGRVSDVD